MAGHNDPPDDVCVYMCASIAHSVRVFSDDDFLYDYTARGVPFSRRGYYAGICICLIPE